MLEGGLNNRLNLSSRRRKPGASRRADTPLPSNARHRRRVTGRVRLVRLEHRVRDGVDEPRLDQDRDDLPRRQPESTVVQRGEQLGDLARVARDAEPRLVVGAEHIVEDLLRARRLRVVRLALVRAPQLVLLGEALLELELGEHVLDVRPVRAPVARVHRHALAEALLDDRHERPVLGDLDVAKRHVGGDGAARQRARVVRLEVRHVLRRVQLLEVRVRLERLDVTGGREVRVRPRRGAISVLLGPVALPQTLARSSRRSMRWGLQPTFQAGVP